MPRLSIVLVVHREQAYVSELAGSVLEQDLDGVELLAIDDASPDHSPELLDELAERSPHVHVRHLTERLGQGGARNLALDAAEGDYVWFAHASDRLPAGSLAAVLERLSRTDPDVLLLHHARSDALGRERPGPHRALLAALADAGTGTLAERPELAAAAAGAFDKVFRRSFLERLGARFGDGAHGELTVTWPALAAAARIAATPVVTYVRRELPNAARDDGSPLDVFARYDAVLDLVGEPARRLVLPAMLRHQLAILARLPESERRPFFERMSESYRRHLGSGELAEPNRVARTRARLVERGSYGAFTALERSIATRRSLARRRSGLVRRARSRASAARRRGLERHYHARLREPIDPDLAVFAAYWYRGYSCNPRAIYEKARELVPGLRGVWVVERDAAASLPAGVEHVVAGTREYYDTIARARWFVNNVNFPNHLVKRDGTVHVMTHHGTPLKKMGLDLRDAGGKAASADFAGLLRRCARWDYSVSANPFSTLIWERAYPLPYESLEVGYPRNDVLARAGDDDVRRIRAELGIEPGRRVVLYAPTHREYQSDDIPLLDLAAVADGLGPEYVLMARRHYFYGEDPVLRELHREGRVLDVAGHPSVEELCIAADVLVTDYSSIMFDYAVLDRPIVIHAPDWDVYREMRGTYFDLMEERPGVVARNEAELVDAFRSGAASGDEARAARAKFRTRFCSLEDGHAAERVVRRVWLGEPAAAVQPAATEAAR